MDALLDCDIAHSAISSSSGDMDDQLSSPAKGISIGSTDVIAPFHAARVPAQRAAKAALPSRAIHNGSKNRYNRVRRRSPLCHDMLEFMLEGASMSSQESLPLETAVATSNPNAGSNVNIRHDHCVSASAATGADLNVSFADAHSRTFLRNLPIPSDAGALCPKAPPSRDLVSTAAVVGDQRSDNTRAAPAALLGTQARQRGSKEKISTTSPASSYASDDGGSDDEASGNSDDGFDGQCPTSSAATSPSSTAECSRSNSYRSSHSSEASDDATATDTSLSWWKRRFRGTKHKLAPRLSAMPKAGALTTADNVGSATSGTDADSGGKPPMTMLTKLRRSVSSKKSARSTALEPVRRSFTVSVPPKKLTRAAAETRASLASTRLEATGHIDAARPASVALYARASPSSLGDEDTFEAQWIMLKCKGMVNLHIVSVPASISSLNHKDAFLFYPCLFRKLGTAHGPGSGAALLALNNAAIEASSPISDAQSNSSMSRLHASTLLAQEYNRRKSICSLASRVVYAWIGAHASVIKRDAIIRVAREICDKELMGKATVLVVDEATVADSARRKLFMQLHLAEHAGRASPPSDMATLCKQLTPLSKAGDDLDFERALERRKVVYGFWETVPPATIISVGADINAAMLLKVPAGGVVVLDTWSDVFIWWRDEPGNPSVRKCATDFANMLVRDACIPSRPKSASVWHELRGFEHVIFKTKFSDWPFVFASSMAATTYAARRAAPAAGSTMSLLTQPMRSPSRSSQAIIVA